ncbi:MULTISPECIES: hypothetical protein [unclassified Bacillus (in: firmicutes)]|uniref:hypothetical protein n=1 Tax=unclassified Bacillus (in: firmicutes) TaxID=185979 RepID=UPI000BF3B363|nr:MULTISPECIES: hypothetical protein [unclassified Bacillus (in: firmicutes)]PEU10660.1 hypothetical protein CN525_23310 [Bacillus sp. AFS014408]PFW59209.1 hypothetical protein COL20_24680 [Bacillus sp. AFS075034]
MEKFPVEFTIISPNSEVYEPGIVYITANTPDAAIQQVENEIESRMGKHYTYKVKISIPTDDEQLSLF